MLTAHTRLISLSNPVIAVLASLPQVNGVLCFGSYAVGTFDASSDIDLFVVCQPDIPTPDARGSALKTLPMIEQLEIQHAETGWDSPWCPQNDRFSLDGCPFDMVYNRLAWLQTVVRKVVAEGEISISEMPFRPYTLPGMLENGAILYDPQGTLGELGANLQPYPARLRQALLAQNLEMMHASLEDMNDYSRRGVGNTAFHFHLGRVLNALETALFALNRRYDPATKRTERAFAQLPILPEDFLERYNRLLETPLTHTGRQQIVTGFSALLLEIESLAARHPDDIHEANL